mgnify:CR=1 FL=1
MGPLKWYKQKNWRRQIRMVRLYGKAPDSPGTWWSRSNRVIKGLAQEINERLQVGVVEALQSKYSIDM